MAKRHRSKKQRILSGLADRSIVLVGMMGSGKSAIGRMIGKSLGTEFVDSDAEIEKAADRTIADIFEEFGEDEFRRLEERVITRLLNEGPYVLALGGGAFLNDTTRQSILDGGFSIWLDVDLDILVERVARRPEKRPLLANGNPAEILKDLLDKRVPIYKQANLQVSSSGGTKANTRNEVLNALDAHFAQTMTERNP